MPNTLQNVYPEPGGCAQTAGIKIQLEYDLHSGQFLNIQVGPGKNNDKTYGTECLETLRPGDLCIRDLGYFSLEDLDQIGQRGTYYIPRLKLNTNVYVTNTSWEWVPMEQVHELYSLRWQIEIVFKTWKSPFEIEKCRDVKKERLECQVYGKLITIFLCSSTMFQMRQLILQKKQKELSEYKAIGMIQDHLYILMQQNTQEVTKILVRLFHLLQKDWRKSHRYEKKQSLISWVFIMSIVQRENIRKLHTEKLNLNRLLWHAYFLKYYTHSAISN